MLELRAVSLSIGRAPDESTLLHRIIRHG